MNATQQNWWNNKKEMKRVNAMLAEAGKKHEEELNAGKPLNLSLAKVRRPSL